MYQQMTLQLEERKKGATASIMQMVEQLFLIVGNASASDDFVGWGDAASVTVPGATNKNMVT